MAYLNGVVQLWSSKIPVFRQHSVENVGGTRKVRATKEEGQGCDCAQFCFCMAYMVRPPFSFDGRLVLYWLQ